jgi:phosphatidylinositol alpha 1,6-mannosyltransferase
MALSTGDNHDELEMVERIKSADRPQDSELRVLIFTATYFVLDGVTLTIRRLESHLRAAGAVVKVISTVPEDVDPEHMENVISVPGVGIPLLDGGGYSFGVGLDPDVTSIIEEFRPTIVHFTAPDFVAMDGIKWCQKNNIPYMATWHSNLVDYLKYYFLDWLLASPLQVFMKGFYEQIPSVYVPTPYILNKMKDEGFGNSCELKQWGRGCDLKIFRPDRRSQSFRQSKGISENDVVILWVGRLVPEKRPDIWLQCVKRLQDEGIPVKALIVGHGNLESSLREIDYHNCGWLSGLALAEAYASCDILLFPSGVETFGNVTLEALASGCVGIVEQNCSGHLVQNGYNGYTCPDGDFEAYYAATRKAVTDHANRKKMAENARESSWNFERSKIMQQMLENYKDAIVSHRDPTYIKRFVNKSPEANGRNIVQCVCCNYWFTKTLAGPFLQTTVGIHDVWRGAKDCATLNRGRMSCGSLASLNYSSIEDNDLSASEALSLNNGHNDDSSAESGENRPCVDILSGPYCARFVRYGSLISAYLIIFMLIWTCFSLDEEEAVKTISRHLRSR